MYVNDGTHNVLLIGFSELTNVKRQHEIYLGLIK